jgi:hypothetical protein
MRGATFVGQGRSKDESTVTPRTRKLAGTIALLAWVAIYALLAMAVAIVLQVREASGAAELAYYVVAGLAWTLPAGMIIKWMQKS